MKIHLIPIANVIQFNGRRSRHCEKRSDEAIYVIYATDRFMDCHAAARRLAMTGQKARL